MDSTVDSFDSTVFTGADADTHNGFALVGHDRLDVGKVEVDQTGRRDQVGNALDALAEYVISDEESVFKGRLLVDDLEQFIIRNRLFLSSSRHLFRQLLCGAYLRIRTVW